MRFKCLQESGLTTTCHATNHPEVQLTYPVIDILNNLTTILLVSTPKLVRLPPNPLQDMGECTAALAAPPAIDQWGPTTLLIKEITLQVASNVLGY